MQKCSNAHLSHFLTQRFLPSPNDMNFEYFHHFITKVQNRLINLVLNSDTSGSFEIIDPEGVPVQRQYSEKAVSNLAVGKLSDSILTVSYLTVS